MSDLQKIGGPGWLAGLWNGRLVPFLRRWRVKPSTYFRQTPDGLEFVPPPTVTGYVPQFTVTVAQEKIFVTPGVVLFPDYDDDAMGGISMGAFEVIAPSIGGQDLEGSPQPFIQRPQSEAGTVEIVIPKEETSGTTSVDGKTWKYTDWNLSASAANIEYIPDSSSKDNDANLYIPLYDFGASGRALKQKTVGPIFLPLGRLTSIY